MSAAEDLVATGGPSAPAWAFFTAICLALLGIFAEQVRTRRSAKTIGEKAETAAAHAEVAATNAEQAVSNTVNVSNGFAERIDRKLDHLQHTLDEHLTWHVNQKENH